MKTKKLVGTLEITQGSVFEVVGVVVVVGIVLLVSVVDLVDYAEVVPWRQLTAANFSEKDLVFPTAVGVVVIGN